MRYRSKRLTALVSRCDRVIMPTWVQDLLLQQSQDVMGGDDDGYVAKAKDQTRRSVV
jgi:hypothetical protein